MSKKFKGKGKARKGSASDLNKAIFRSKHPVQALVQDLSQEISSLVDFYKLARDKVRERLSKLMFEDKSEETTTETQELTSLDSAISTAFVKAQSIGDDFAELLDTPTQGLEISEQKLRDDMGGFNQTLISEQKKVDDSSRVRVRPIGSEEKAKSLELERMALANGEEEIKTRSPSYFSTILQKGMKKLGPSVTKAAQVAALATGLFLPAAKLTVEFWPSSRLPVISAPFTDAARSKAVGLQKLLESVNKTSEKLRKGKKDPWDNKWFILVPMARTERGNEFRQKFKIEKDTCTLTMGKTVYITYA